jgi:hypothetical protein
MCLRREGHDRRRAGGDAAQRSCRLAGLLPRVRRTSVRDSSQTDGQLSHQAEAASGVAGAASRCRRGGRQTPGWTTCDSAARWPTSSVPPAIRHVLARGNGTSKRPARTPSGESAVRKDTERSVAAERSRHSRRSPPTLCMSPLRPPIPDFLIQGSSSSGSGTRRVAPFMRRRSSRRRSHSSAGPVPPGFCFGDQAKARSPVVADRSPAGSCRAVAESRPPTEIPRRSDALADAPGTSASKGRRQAAAR